jgi:hypothetical protein
VAHTRAQLLEHVRRLFRLGGVNAASRHAWLDTQAEEILAAQFSEGAGSRIASTSANGASVAFAASTGASAASANAQALALIANLRPYADATSVADAISLIPPRCISARPNFSAL